MEIRVGQFICPSFNRHRAAVVNQLRRVVFFFPYPFDLFLLHMICSEYFHTTVLLEPRLSAAQLPRGYRQVGGLNRENLVYSIGTNERLD